ncbi:MAG: Ni/Fe hydrogenase subunit alpha [Desulfatibacillum sp.]|nr:Ni/Fe hydrogenase subunit alpha [Desulfatibacillum sp.]
MSQKITISPITRLEGHGKIDILLDDDGNVKDCYFQVVELRGFERFCQGRPVEELPRIMPKICGVCPGAHHMASSKAADAVYGIIIPPTAKKLRELFYNAHISHSHILHFFALAAPDFIPGPGADPAKRNILGLIDVVGKDIGRAVIRNRGYAQKIQEIICGHAIHPVGSLPGGLSKPITEEERVEIEIMAGSMVDFAQTALQIFQDLVLANPQYKELITGDTYYHETYYAGMVDENNKVNFYDGKIRVKDPDGQELAKFPVSDYLEHIGEHVEPWTYLKFPFLKAIGWKGMKDGRDSGVYRVNSLARLNVSDGMSTPLAQKAYDDLFGFFGCKPVHNTLAFHWARLVENLFAAEEVLRLATDPEITGKDVRTLPTQTPSEGVGAVEAARGTLYHHYVTDSAGMVTKVNLIVATAQNNAGMGMSVKKAAEKLIKNGAADDKLLNMVEMGFRAYDPCLACATHCLPGQSPLEVRIFKQGQLVRHLSRNLD